MDKTNKIMCGLLVFAGMMFLIFHIPYYNPEEEVLKHLKKRYNKEFMVLSSKAIPSREGDLEYDAKIIPVEYLGTYKSIDDYYISEAFIRVKNVSDRYINFLAGESAKEFYSPKLKELFGENIFSVFRIEGDCEKNNIQEELARRKKIYEKKFEEFPREKLPFANYDFDPFRLNIYIFGNKEDIKNKEVYREKIYKFIEYLKETEAFHYTTISIKLIDEEIFTKEKFEYIKKKEYEIAEQKEKELAEYIERISRWSLLSPYIDVEIEENNSTEEENESEIVESPLKDMRDIIDRDILALAELLLNRYGEVLLSTYIISPKKVDNFAYLSEKRFVNYYERKEDICFDGEEQNYPNGTIKEQGEECSYYITETKNNKKNGTSTQYDEFGKVIWEGEYKNNKLDGPFKEYGKYWLKEGMYKNNLIEGEVKCIHKTKGTTIKETYRNGLREGKSIYYNTDGSIDVIYEYKKDKLDGTSKKFRGDGKIYEVIEWKNSEKNGKYIKYDSNGRIEKFIEYKNGMVDGVYKEFYKGQILLDKKYKNNEEYGLTKMYYQNGNIKKEIIYDKGHKLWDKSYSEEGKLKIYNIYDEKYSKVKLRKVYDRDEKLSKEVEYTKDGIEIVREYREKDGTLVSTRYFKDGVEQRNYKE